MRTILAVLVLGVAIVLNAATAFGATASDTRLFFGDGFDNATCADSPRGQDCR
jgi:hypothetical protein